MNDLIALLKRELRIAAPLGPTTPLISSGLVDSFGVADLLTILETTYGVVIPPDAVGVDNFDTPEQILRFVRMP